MSEEILKALMQLFAIVTKQDDGVTDSERNFVIRFLKQQLSTELVPEYLKLYDSFLFGKDENPGDDEKKKKLTSVKDSVKTLAICKKINKTLTQKQKVIVLIRLLELVGADRSFSRQKMQIIDTVSTVFNIVEDEYKLIENFILEIDQNNYINSPHLLLIGEKFSIPEDSLIKVIQQQEMHGSVGIIQIKSVDMYFLKYIGNETVLLNGLPIQNERINLFPYGSTLKLSHGSPIYYSDIISEFLLDSTIQNISFNAKNLEYKFPGGKIGLQDVNISEGPGKLIGIMGGSGAGKTTLLNVLAGLEKPSKGEILINGINLHHEEEAKKIEGMIGYVAQDDILFEELTVYQNLYYNAKLCFGNLSETEIIKRVIQTLKDLGLYEIKDIKVGNVLNKKISGGQRKRLNIALELIREPAILFLDEPTSGLSSRDSENVMDLLKELTLKGKLIFVVIHQPSSDIFKMFDKLVIMDVGGYQIFYGNPVEAVVYFKQKTNQINADVGQCPECGNVNPESIFNSIEARVVDDYGNFTEKRKVSPSVWFSYFQEIPKTIVEDIQEIPQKLLLLPNRINQLKVFITRDLLSKLANTQYLSINLLEAPLLAFVLAFIIRYVENPGDEYHFGQNENVPAYLFMSIIVAIFMGLTVSAEEIIKDAKILKRETFLNLSRLSYINSKIILLFTMSAIQTLCFVLIGNWILGIEGMTFRYWLVLFTCASFANVLGLNISASFNSAVTIYIIIPLLLIPQMILSGAIFSFDKLNKTISSKDKVPFIADMMASRWAFEALAVTQFRDNKLKSKFYEMEQKESDANYKHVYWAPYLLSQIEDIEELLVKKDEGYQQKVLNELVLIENEFKKEAKKNILFKYDEADFVNSRKFQYSAVQHLETNIKWLKEHYSNKFIEINDQKDLIVAKLVSSPELSKLYFEMKRNHENESLSDLVKNVTAKNKIIEYEQKLIQKIDPIYRLPETEVSWLDFSAHLYAPKKHFMGKLHDTFFFNIAMIWLMSIFLYLALYFNLLRKGIESLAKINIPMPKVKRPAFVDKIKLKVSFKFPKLKLMEKK
ncbi:MAG: ATP-binding cassette domain-containing protein [Cytophagales bacterium]